MTAPTTYTYANVYKVGRGRLAFNQLDADGNYTGYRWLGNTPGFDINVESQNLQHTSSEGGLSEVDLDIVLSITRTATINIDNFSSDNLAIFLGATVADIAQTSTSVTNELVEYVRTERFFQLGTSYLPTGVRGITAPTVDVSRQRGPIRRRTLLVICTCQRRQMTMCISAPWPALRLRRRRRLTWLDRLTPMARPRSKTRA